MFLFSCYIFNFAVWSKNELVSYELDACEDAYNIINEPANFENSKLLQTIQAITINDIITEHGFSRIDYLKMDIEGAEKNLLKVGFPDWLQIVQQINIEIHDESFLEEASGILASYGFICHRDDQHACLLKAAKPQ